MTKAPDCVSDMLRELQLQLNNVLSEHGNIHLDRLSSALLVFNIGKMADCAHKLENAWSQAEWNRRAVSDRIELIAQMTRASAEILGLMRPDTPNGSVVVPFPRRPATPQPPSPPGGTAA